MPDKGKDKQALVFLVYDSRSGSTFFSRQLHESDAAIVVTPEINLVKLVRCFQRERSPSWLNIKNELEDGRILTALSMSMEDLESCYESAAQLPFEKFLLNIFQAFAEKNGNSTAKVFVVKKGESAWIAGELVKLVPSARFIYMRRNPLDIYKSKKHTLRPYRPWQSMAWAGVFYHALRWNKFESFSKRKDLNLLVIGFERMTEISANGFSMIYEWLGISPVQTNNFPYLISDQEKKIHSKAAQKNIVAASGRELNAYEKRLISVVSKRNMKANGYKFSRIGFWSYLLVPVAMCESLVKISLGFFKNWFHRGR